MSSECRVRCEIWNACAYQIRHFENLCAFCKIENAPLRTNDVERSLKNETQSPIFCKKIATCGIDTCETLMSNRRTQISDVIDLAAQGDIRH